MAPGPRGQDVVFSFFLSSWAHGVSTGSSFSEDRLAATLMAHPDVRRLLIANPYRSLAGKLTARVRRSGDPEFPATATRQLFEPIRLRRTDPLDPARTVARYEARLRRAARRNGLERPAIITGSPLIAGFGDFAWAGPVTYYAWDDWLASEPQRQYWPAYEEAFRRVRERGRRVVAVTAKALDRIAPTGPNAVIPNGVDADEWATLGAPPAWFAGKPHPRLLYVGSLDSRVDVGQAQAVAEAFPDGSLTLVGTMLDEAQFATLRTLPNVEIHDPVAREEVVRLIGAADACLVPHARNALTEAMSPLKLFEYLAGGRPVAAVDLPPIAAVQGAVELVGEGGDFAAATRRALERGPAGEADRLAFVAANSWASRFDAFLELALAD
ncbi:glycosyltransferase [Solirubrobacter soli]|uniref:glycosyltransferase n=1 Tax=Solirubrobacter soli TaxID=363832 RepID=UPI00040FCEE7|nr:glycosyltransferase [Solirubrobacter soli]